ncbi:MAG TPA: FtsX-like permease family protein, partial [Bacteroidales bacterium]|nr:FtsX-like permease family protein [Bacteroidales bacterium]
LGITMDEWLTGDNRYGYFLEPLTGIWLNSEASMQPEPVGNKKYVIIFSLVAVFILLIACVNFMNLTTAKASNRAKEVGMRKVVGARRRQLIYQFLSESVMLSLIALAVALILVHLMMPTFNNLTQKELTIPYWSNPWFIPGLLMLALITGLVAGSYSSISLSSFNIIPVLKGKIQSGSKGAIFRSGLVIFQFAISVAIIIGTFVVYSQLQYMQNKKPGFDKEHVLVIERPYALGSQLKSFRQELLRHPDIITAAASSQVPGSGFSGSVYQREGAASDEMIHFRSMTGDYDFPEAMGMKMKAGRYFTRDFPGDTMNVVINETAVKNLGYEDPVGRYLMAYGPDMEVTAQRKIIGVVEDFHTESMHEQIPNVVMFFPGNYHASYMAIKVNGQNISQTLSKVEKLWQEFLPQQPFDYFFMDSYFDNLHKAETRTGKLLGSFSVLALFIASMGLFGLSSFITVQRTKEIGVRKVMGSTTSNILLLLNKQFTKWILIANLVAWPMAWYFMTDWLRNFAYRIDLSPAIFLLVGLGSVLLALMTVSYQTFRAATVNPAHSLRDE